MLKKMTLLWVVGLLTWVPYGTYYLLFQATRDQYAWLIVSILFWIFGFWGVVGPLITAVKLRRVFKSFENVKSKQDLKRLIEHADTREVAIELIASENKIPKFIATRVYEYFSKRLQ